MFSGGFELNRANLRATLPTSSSTAPKLYCLQTSCGSPPQSSSTTKERPMRAPNRVRPAGAECADEGRYNVVGVVHGDGADNTDPTTVAEAEGPSRSHAAVRVGLIGHLRQRDLRLQSLGGAPQPEALPLLGHMPSRALCSWARPRASRLPPSPHHLAPTRPARGGAPARHRSVTRWV